MITYKSSIVINANPAAVKTALLTHIQQKGWKIYQQTIEGATTHLVAGFWSFGMTWGAKIFCTIAPTDQGATRLNCACGTRLLQLVDFGQGKKLVGEIEALFVH